MNANRTNTILSLSACLASALVAAAPASAQWSHNPAANSGLVVGGSDQNQAKSLPTADGGWYLVWLDGIGTGWDTRLQRYDSHGVAQWASSVLVADTAFSSTQDYGFAVDAAGNAIIAYRDDGNVGGSPVQIKMQKVDAAGNLLWGSGTQVSATAGGSAPHCCATSDGGAVVGWTTSGGAAAMQKVDSSGAPQWTAGGIIDTQPAGIYFVSDVVADNAGGAIGLYHHQTGGFTSPRYLKMQRFDSASGAKLWNSATPVAIFEGTGNSVVSGFFPYLVSDGSGGAMVAWYNGSTASTRNAYLQHVDANGVEVFPHNGITIADDVTGRMRIWATLTLDASTGDIYMIAKEGNISPQGSYSLRVQKFDAAGARQWGNLGVEVLSQGATQPSFAWAQALASGQGAMFVWDNGGFNAQQVFATRLNTDGTAAWTPSTLTISSVLSGKARLWISANAARDRALITWADNRTAGTNDIYGACVSLNGSSGNPGDVDDNGSVDVNDLLGVITTWGACPAPPTLCPADIAPAPLGDGQVDVNDLLATITNWG